MDQGLVERTREWLAAGFGTDADALGAFYDPEFENLRVDEAGRTAVLTKADIVDRYRGLLEQGVRINGSMIDHQLVATSRHGDQGTAVVFYRNAAGDQARYSCVWRWEDGQWTTLLRQFTFERDIRGLEKTFPGAVVRG